MTSRFREIPSVTETLRHPALSSLAGGRSHDSIVEIIREELASARRTVAAGADPPDVASVARAVSTKVALKWRTWPERVINATGVILHTNLGRAPLSDESVAAAALAATGYSDLEFDLDSGKRGSRQAHISRLTCEATGAEAALIVNNNASAVMLGLAAIAAGKEVIVSRGEAVEIGGGFRIPDVLRQSGATLVEVGTTNRTYARDFEAAITANTGAILSVHASNFRVMGFTHAPTTAELVTVGDRYGVPALHDLGSGCMLDTRPYGLAWEPRPQESVRAGVALGFFSGDKLLGGPQAGIIVGKREYVSAVASHPLARAVRIDKMSMAALSATMLHYIRDDPTEKIPIWRMISAPLDELRERASKWRASAGAWSEIVSTRAAIGGGSLPGETIESVALRIESARLGRSAEDILTYLRQQDVPIIGRIEGDDVLLDTRAVLPAEDSTVISVLRNLNQ